MKTLGRQGKYYKTLQIIIACLNCICYVNVHWMNFEFIVLEMNALQRIDSLLQSTWVCWHDIPKDIYNILYIEGFGQFASVWNLWFSSSSALMQLTAHKSHYVQLAQLENSILYLHKLIETYNSSLRHDLYSIKSDTQHFVFFCMLRALTSSWGPFGHRVDIWRDRFDRRSCKILVSRVNFQKTSGTAQQFTQS